MGHVYQPTLFDGEELLSPAIDVAAFGATTDHRLDEHSWITHVPGLLTGHQQLLAELATLDVWEQRQRWMFDRLVDEPRLTGEYVDLTTAPALLAELAVTLGERLGVPHADSWSAQPAADQARYLLPQAETSSS
jgi:hypothetical protein